MPAETMEEKNAARREFFVAMSDIIERRRNEPPRMDFLSLMALSPHSQNYTQTELVGDCGFLLVGATTPPATRSARRSTCWTATRRRTPSCGPTRS